MLEVRGASFERAGRALFQDVSFRLRAGEVLCVLGPNGVGKTTLLRCLAGLERLHGGTVLLDGCDIGGMTRRGISRVVGLVPQNDAPDFAYSVREMVEMGRAPHLGWLAAPTAADRGVVDDALRRLSIVHLAERPYPELSGGERQMVLIARALVQQARLLILDEPTAHLDFGRQAAVMDLILELAAEDLALVVTTHDPDHAFRVATTVLLMPPDGIVVAGLPNTVLTADNLSRTYGRIVRVLEVEGRTLCIAEASRSCKNRVST